jgi:hypothetical protein
MFVRKGQQTIKRSKADIEKIMNFAAFSADVVEVIVEAFVKFHLRFCQPLSKTRIALISALNTSQES